MYSNVSGLMANRCVIKTLELYVHKYNKNEQKSRRVLKRLPFGADIVKIL